jgi:hypothetical protein
MRGPARHLTYANVVSTLALFLVVAGGLAYAANTIFSSDIVDGEVKSVDIANDSVTGDDLKNGGVQGADVLESSLGLVPDADKLDGMSSAAFERSSRYASWGLVRGGPSGPLPARLSLNGFQFSLGCAGSNQGLAVYPPVDHSVYAVTLSEGLNAIGRYQTDLPAAGAYLYTTPDDSVSFQTISGWAASPNGKRVSFQLFMGRGVLGSDANRPCVAGGYAVNR